MAYYIYSNNYFKIISNKILRSKILSFLILVCITIIFILILTLNLNKDCKCDNAQQSLNSKSQIKYRDDHKLCLIVPFRDRFDELLLFVTHMKMFLNKQNVDYSIFVLNQVDSFRFNRGSLINVGFTYINKYTKCDYIGMHDVDLIPMNLKLDYSYPDESIMHIAAPNLHPKYHYKTFLGGILIMNNQHFEQVNGLSNKYWGWGLEDDELYVRIKEAGIPIKRPSNISTGTENTFKHFHDKSRRKRDMIKCYNQKEVTRRRDRETGLSNVEFQIPTQYDITINESSATVLNVILYCNSTVTPWCLCKNSNGKQLPR